MKKADVANIAKLIVATRKRGHAFFLPFEIERESRGTIKKTVVMNSLNVLRDMGAFDYAEIPWNPQDDDQWDEMFKENKIPRPLSELEIKYNLNEVGVMFLHPDVLDAMNNHTPIPNIGKKMDVELLGKIIASPALIPDKLMQKYGGTSGTKVRSILFVERDHGHPNAIVVNEDYDNPIGIGSMKGGWKMLYDIARDEYVDETYDENRTEQYMDFFNSNRHNKLYTQSHCVITRILSINDGRVEQAIEELNCISEKALKQRQGKKSTT